MNELIEPVEAEVIPEVKPKKKASGFKIMRAFRVFGFIDRERIIKMLPFMFFLTLLGLIYIGNSYFAERTIRDIDKTSKQIKELRSEYISTKSELMYKSKQSEVASMVSPLGIKESIDPPKKIVVKAPTEKK